MNSIITGLMAGTIATVPMTLVMAGLFRLLPRREQYPLPPREITENLTKKIGVDERLDEPKLTGLTLLAHFAYGAICGAIYAPLAKAIAVPRLWSGFSFGILIWIVSYLGILPALGSVKIFL